MLTWAVIERCGGQVRVGMGGPYALDFGAILMMAAAMGVATGLLVEVLPVIEPLIIKAYREASGDGE